MLKRAKRNRASRYLFRRAHASPPPVRALIRRALPRLYEQMNQPASPLLPNAVILSGQGAGCTGDRVLRWSNSDPDCAGGWSGGTFMEILEKNGRDTVRTRCCQGGLQGISAE